MTRIRRLAGIAAVGVFFTATVAVPVTGQSVVAGPTAAQVATAVGDRVTVPVMVDMTGASGISLGSYQLAFRWDPAVLKYVGSSAGGFAVPAFNTDSVSLGLVRFAGANASGAVGVVILGNVTLEVLATDTSSAIAVEFSELTAASTFQDLIPFLTETSFTFCPGRYLGDLDGNRLVQALDAQIVLMHAVGLAVSDTSAGDVDSDRKVDPRDALIILSHVVGLDVSPFKVERFSGGACAFGIPSSVTINPQSFTLAAGDVLTAEAEVRDSTGALLGGLNLSWSSSDPTIAVVDSNGAITAGALGTTTVLVAAAPGVSDTATVTVDERHRWIVNPTVAQGQPTELGTPTYPFSTIAQAIDSAAAGDTIKIAVATYREPLTTTKRLIFEGDSGANGMPIISTPDEPAGQLTVSGTQVLRRLEIAESQRGLEIDADIVVLISVRLRAIRGRALEIRNADYVGLAGVYVDGAVGAGISLDSVGAVGLIGVQVAGVGPALEELGDSVFAAGVLALNRK